MAFQEDPAMSMNILVNNKPLAAPLISAHITLDSHSASSALLKFPGGDIVSEEFTLSEGPDLAPGNTIIFEAGYGSERSVIFSGTIEKQSLCVSNGIEIQLIVECAGPPATKPTEQKGHVKCTLGDNIIDIHITVDSKGNFSGTLTCPGTTKVEPLGWIRLERMGGRFTKDINVRNVAHKLELGNWLTTFTLGNVE